MTGSETTTLLYIIGFASFLFGANFQSVRLFSRWSLARRFLLDIPNERSSHTRPTVGGAGVLFVLSTVFCWLLIELRFQTGYLLSMSIGAFLLAIVGLWDDLVELSIFPRLAMQFGAALLFLACIPVPNFLWVEFGVFAFLWFPLAAFFIVAVTNLYNFMDGIDGMAASHSLCVLSSWVLFGLMFGATHAEMLICVALGIPLFAYLLHNWHPAKVFMGDVGSTFLGFTFGCLAVIQVPGFPRSVNFFALLMLMMPFLFDTTFTIIVRMLRGEKWYRPHNYHIFQRLVRVGYSHGAVALLYCGMTLYAGLMLLCVRQELITHYLVGLPLFMLPYPLLYLFLARSEMAAHRAAIAMMEPSELAPVGVAGTEGITPLPNVASSA